MRNLAASDIPRSCWTKIPRYAQHPCRMCGTGCVARRKAEGPVVMAVKATLGR